MESNIIEASATTSTQSSQPPKQLFQMHLSQLESINTHNNECYSFITKNISSFISILEPFKNKLHSLFLNCSSSNLPLFKVFKQLFEHYYLNINTLIDNCKLINQGLETPLKNYKASFSKIKQLKDLQNKFVSSYSKLSDAKYSYNSEFKKFKHCQYLTLEDATDEFIIGKTHTISRIKECENEYKAILSDINIKLDVYNQQGNSILQEIQRNEQLLQSAFQSQVKKFATHWIDKTEKDSQFVSQLKKTIDTTTNAFFKPDTSLSYLL